MRLKYLPTTTLEMPMYLVTKVGLSLVHMRALTVVHVFEVLLR